MKSEAYPDPYLHMTVKCLEYPESTIGAANKKDALNRANKRFNRRNNIRYMTQPVTLIEIKETEETAVFAFKPNHSKEN